MEYLRTCCASLLNATHCSWCHYIGFGLADPRVHSAPVVDGNPAFENPGRPGSHPSLEFELTSPRSEGCHKETAFDDTPTSDRTYEEGTTSKESGCVESMKRNKIRPFLLLAMMAMIILIVADSICCNTVSRLFESVLIFVENNPGSGFVAFVLIFAFASTIFVPGAILTLGAGAVFGKAYGTGVGLVVGTLAVVLGATLSSIISFLLGRYIVSDVVKKYAQRYTILKAVDAAFQKEGLKLMLLLRLSPIIPFAAFNYAISVTNVSFADFLLGCVGFIPGSMAYVYFGAIAGTAGENGNGGTINIIIYAVGAAATILAITLVSIYSKRALDIALAEDEAQSPFGHGESSSGPIGNVEE